MTDHEMQPYRALACCVIWQGLQDAVTEDAPDAPGWLMSKREEVGDFIWWCEMAGISHQLVKRMALKRFVVVGKLAKEAKEFGVSFKEMANAMETLRRESPKGEDYR